VFVMHVVPYRIVRPTAFCYRTSFQNFTKPIIGKGAKVSKNGQESSLSETKLAKRKDDSQENSTKKCQSHFEHSAGQVSHDWLVTSPRKVTACFDK